MQYLNLEYDFIDYIIVTKIINYIIKIIIHKRIIRTYVVLFLANLLISNLRTFKNQPWKKLILNVTRGVQIHTHVPFIPPTHTHTSWLLTSHTFIFSIKNLKLYISLHGLVIYNIQSYQYSIFTLLLHLRYTIKLNKNYQISTSHNCIVG